MHRITSFLFLLLNFSRVEKERNFLDDKLVLEEFKISSHCSRRKYTIINQTSKKCSDVKTAEFWKTFKLNF